MVAGSSHHFSFPISFLDLL